MRNTSYILVLLARAVNNQLLWLRGLQKKLKLHNYTAEYTTNDSTSINKAKPRPIRFRPLNFSANMELVDKFEYRQKYIIQIKYERFR